MKCDFVRIPEFCFFHLALFCQGASLLPLHIMFIVCKTIPSLLFPLWSVLLLVHLPFSFIFITFSAILTTFIPHCYLLYCLSLNTTAIHSWEIKAGDLYTVCCCRWEGQHTKADQAISENYMAVHWTPMRAQILHQLYHESPLSMQCNQSTGERFPGYWENMPLTPVLFPTLAQPRDCTTHP